MAHVGSRSTGSAYAVFNHHRLFGPLWVSLDHFGALWVALGLFGSLCFWCRYGVVHAGVAVVVLNIFELFTRAVTEPDVMDDDDDEVLLNVLRCQLTY